MTINLIKSNLPKVEKFIKLLKPLSIGCGVVAIALIAIYPLMSNKSVENVEGKVEEKSTVLLPASYTIIMGEKDDEVILKFHNQNSVLHLKNIDAIEYNCLLNGGGVNCVLAPAYQPKIEVVESEVNRVTQTEIKRQTWKIPDIEVSRDMMDNFIVVVCVIIGLILLKKFSR